jgi:alanyl-tRNA synthetase
MPPSRILTANEVRQQFIDFFAQRAAHTFVPSSPVVPHEDPTLLFTNAGMNQFKPIFLGQVAPTSPLAALKRAVNSQKCIRAGGKHNDLDDVGRDTYHHTFFEMLGNWSFGDYFKVESIQWAWELLTEIWGLDSNRLYASYFEGNPALGLEPDRESFDLWRKYLPASRIIPGNMKDNFWEMGDTGPCGPCSEIHYDGRSDADRARVPGDTLVNRDSPEVIEIWNLVFIQFNRTGPTSLDPLPAKHVDTGMGLERVTRVLQGKSSNYDTDAFTPLFARIREITGAPAYDGGPGSLTNPVDVAYRVIADHARTLTISITDGAEPSNEGRGYVLRRILRRAVRFGRQVLGHDRPFMGALVPTVVESLGGAFPELKKDPQRVIDILTDEEEAFGRTLTHGLALFDKAATTPTITADDAFKLHDTYGFPIDLTQLMAAERGLKVDVDGFHRLMEEARERSRGGAGGAGAESGLTLNTSAVASLQKLGVKPTDDAPKHAADRPVRARVEALWNGTDFDEHLVASHTRPTDRFAVILDKSCFYAESGGQTSDAGRLVVAGDARSSVRESASGGGGEFIVEETRITAGYIVHIGRIRSGEVRVGDFVEARIDQKRRKQIAANHTGTHMLNRALRATLGAHVDQKGSLVAPDRLRFDFAHHGPLTDTESAAVSALVRADIAANLEVFAQVAPLAPARKINTLRAVFGETYPDPVRIVSIGAPIDALLANPNDPRWMDRSVEFCGGTHLARTGDAGAFAVIAEEGVSKGVRRIVALTGDAAQTAIDAGGTLRTRAEGAATLPEVHLKTESVAIQHELESGASGEIPVEDRIAIRAILERMHDRLKERAKESAKAGKGAAVDAARALAASSRGPIVIGEIPAASDRAALLAALDVVRSTLADSAVMLVSADADAGKVTIVAQVPKSLMDRGLKAGDWVRIASEACGGKGGGRPDSAQGGGTDPSKVQDAIRAARAHASSVAGAAHV